MYRLISETLLGFERTGDQVRLLPRLPSNWTGFVLRLRHGRSTWRFQVRMGDSARVTVDGVERPDGVVTLTDDGAEHQVLVETVRPAP